MSLKPFYSGHPFRPAWPGPPPFSSPHRPDHDFFAGCCHPAAACCCHVWQCRKESKELTVVPGARKIDALAGLGEMAHYLHMMITQVNTPLAAEQPAAAAEQPAPAVRAVAERFDHGNAFIGGSCCVHLSVEY